jgi:hypothetical protein
MGGRFKFNLLPSLLPEEKVLFVNKWVWFSSGSSSPNYRILFSLPPLWEQGVYITDRRVLFIAHLFRLLTQEFYQWFEGKGVPGDNEFIKEVTVGRNWLLGPYLQVVSENPKARFRSSRARVRLYMRKPEPACRIITEEMTKSTQNGQQKKDSG